MSGTHDAAEPRRLTRKGQATRDRIVTAAAALMHARGVAGTNTEDVQHAAGVSTSQIYHYFADKKALTRAVIAHQTQAVLDMQTSWMSRLDSVEALQAWRDFVVGAQHQAACRGGCPIGSLAAELADADPDARVDLASAYQRWQEAIRDGLAAMRERGEIARSADPERLALALLAAVQGGLLLTQTRRDTIALEAALDTVIDGIRRHVPDPDAEPCYPG